MVTGTGEHGALRDGELPMSRILVSGCGGPAGHSVKELLLQRGHSVIAVDMKPSDSARIIQVPQANDPNFVPELEKIARHFDCDLVIPTVSEELPVLADRWGSSGIPIVISSSKSVKIANDKFSTCAHLKSQGVAVPKYRLLSWKTDGLGWPLISKPRVGRGGREVAVHESEKTLAGLDDRYILQEFVGSSEYAPNINLHNGKSIVVVLKKTKLKQGIVGNALSVRRVQESDIAEMAIKAAEAMGLAGPVDIDIRRRSDGTPVVLDVNARFGANLAFAPEVLDAVLKDYLT